MDLHNYWGKIHSFESKVKTTYSLVQLRMQHASDQESNYYTDLNKDLFLQFLWLSYFFRSQCWKAKNLSKQFNFIWDSEAKMLIELLCNLGIHLLY